MSRNTTEYIIPLTMEDRYRHRHVTEKGKLVAFVIQYETFVRGKWYPVVRYDTAHGIAHRDLLSPINAPQKMTFTASDYSSVLAFGREDILKSWERYKTNYLKELKEND